MDKEILIIFSALINFILGLIVYFKGAEKTINKNFFFLSLLVSIWSIALFFYTHPILFSALEWIKITYFFGLSIVPLFFYFCSILTNQISKKTTKAFLIIYFIILIPLLWVLFNTKLFIREVIFSLNGYQTFFGPAYLFCAVFTGSYLLISLSILIKKSLKSSRVERLQIQYIILGVSLFGLSAFFIDLILPISAGISDYFWISPILSIFFIGFIFLAILKYHLFGIKIILTELLVGIMGIILLIQIFLAPTLNWRISSLVVFLLFCVFGYYLIKYTRKEEKLRKQAEDLAEGLKQLNEAKTVFINTAAHDLRAPLLVFSLKFDKIIKRLDLKMLK
ncbi:MAG: histidine kinase N-terminal 7TM domain-containing protein [Candidatus Pacebacteria bacterium]|nr:histidine kinase N-terminal 7TM domain-containing protein [Candidatus Paceibacterota bacterium]